MTLIAYGKLGRAMYLNPESYGVGGGDDEPAEVLRQLMDRNPDWQFLLMSRCLDSREEIEAAGFDASRIINPWLPKLEYTKKEIRPGYTTGTREWVKIYQEELWRVLAPYVDQVDGMVVWIGQHGSCCQIIPKAGPGPVEETIPLEQSITYGSYVNRLMNAWRDRTDGRAEPIVLCPDPRNYWKCRDTKWPFMHPVLGQYEFSRVCKYYRWHDKRDPNALGFDGVSWDEPEKRVWRAVHKYQASGLEILGVPADIPFDDDPDGRGIFGMVVSEQRGYGGIEGMDRLSVLREWVYPAHNESGGDFLAFIAGVWSDYSTSDIKTNTGITPRPVRRDKVHVMHQAVKYTLTTPASASNWATSKPWDCFAAGVICFFHPAYDAQNSILQYAPRELRDMLRCDKPETMYSRIAFLEEHPDEWSKYIMMQRAYFNEQKAASRCLVTIENRLQYSIDVVDSSK